MVVDYDPFHGMAVSAMHLKSTVVSDVIVRSEFYLFLLLHIVIRVLHNQEYLDPDEYHVGLTLMMTGVTGGLMTFFVVFYNGYVFSRYNRLYFRTKKLNEECLITASIIARDVTDIMARRKLTRMLLASSGLFFFQRTPAEDGGCEDGKASNVSKREWAQLEQLRLLDAHELKILKKHDRAAGTSSMPSFLLLQWSMKLCRSLMPRHNDLEKAYWRVRCCQDDVIEILEMPMPFQYFHLMNLMLMVNLTMWAYSFALLESMVASVIYVFVQLMFQGIRELSIGLSDPYGTDDCDFPLQDWWNALWLRVVAVVEDDYDLSRVLPVADRGSLPMPTHGETFSDIFPDNGENPDPRGAKRGLRRRVTNDLNDAYTKLPQVEGNVDELVFFMENGYLPIDTLNSTQEEKGHAANKEEEEVKDKVNNLEDELEKLQLREEERSDRLEEMNDMWSRRTEAVAKELQTINTEQSRINAEIDVLEHPEEGPPPPGPTILRFIERDTFHCLASLVIVGNIVTMIMQEVDHSYKAKFIILNHCYMVFYLGELFGKIALLQRSFFLGKASVVVWSWLDLVIVGSGVVESYLKPLIDQLTGGSGGGHGSSPLSFLRALRLFRVLKIVGLFLQADMSWTEGARFQLFIMGVIGFNSVLMGLESDMPDFFMWYYIEQLLLVIFSFEILVRMKLAGCHFWVHQDDWAWNWLDSTIVGGGIVDQWLMPTISFVKKMTGEAEKHGEGSNSLGQLMMMLRMARLLRILRLVRLVKSIPPLYTLIIGIVQAMQGMVWVLVLTTLVLYAFALLGVKLIGHGLVLGPNAPDEVKDVFHDVLESMFVLFKSMNGDWEPLRPLFEFFPISKAIFIMFTVISTWAILSILTAVVSDNMMNATNEHRDEIEEEVGRRSKERSMIKMMELFQRHEDFDGYLSRGELDALVEDEDAVAELEDATGLGKKDMVIVFTHLARPHPGENGNFEYTVSHADFISGLQKEKNPVVERSVMRLERQVHDVHTALAAVAQEMKMMRTTGTDGPLGLEDTQGSCETLANSLIRQENRGEVRASSGSGTATTPALAAVPGAAAAADATTLAIGESGAGAAVGSPSKATVSSKATSFAANLVSFAAPLVSKNSGGNFSSAY